MDRILIVIITYNSYSIFKTLDSLILQDNQNYQLLLIDNNSESGFKLKIWNYLRSHLQLKIKTEVIQNEVNVGFAKAVNIGIQKLLKDRSINYLFLLNPDTFFPPNLLSAGLNVFDTDKLIGACCPVILYPDKRIWWVGTKLLSNKEILKLDNFSISEHLLKNQHWYEENQPIQEVELLTGCAMFISKQAIIAVGDFNERYFMYVEDVDYSLRLKHKNFKLIKFETSKVFHNVGSKDKETDQGFFYTLKRRKYYLKSVFLYLLDNKPIHILVLWILKIPISLVWNFFRK